MLLGPLLVASGLSGPGLYPEIITHSSPPDQEPAVGVFMQRASSDDDLKGYLESGCSCRRSGETSLSTLLTSIEQSVIE